MAPSASTLNWIPTIGMASSVENDVGYVSSTHMYPAWSLSRVTAVGV